MAARKRLGNFVTEKIRSFLEKTQLRLNVALDKNGKIGVLYGARAIPQTVIIGKDGTVQVIHVGSLEDLQKKLTEDLDALLAGKNLVTEAAVLGLSSSSRRLAGRYV